MKRMILFVSAIWLCFSFLFSVYAQQREKEQPQNPPRVVAPRQDPKPAAQTNPSASEADLIKLLDTSGPQVRRLSKTNKSAFSVQAFVRGNWPMVIDYELQQSGFVLITITREGIEPFYYRIDGTRPGRRQEVIRIPFRFGQSPKPAQYTILALSDNLGVARQFPMRIYRFGAGEKAIGSSSSLSEFSCKPDSIYPGQGGRVSYTYTTRKPFAAARVSIYREDNTSDESTLIKEEEIQYDIRQQISREGWWDGRDKDGNFSEGIHIIELRLWESSDDKSWQAAVTDPPSVYVYSGR